MKSDTTDRVKKPVARHAPHRAQSIDAAKNQDALLSVSTVSELCGLGRSSIYAKERRGTFPQAIRMGTRCTRWRAGDVTDWLKAQAASKGAAK